MIKYKIIRGNKIPDPFLWLGEKNKSVLKYVEKENNRTDKYFSQSGLPHIPEQHPLYGLWRHHPQQ